jgi:hypothetical protein
MVMMMRKTGATDQRHAATRMLRARQHVNRRARSRAPPALLNQRRPARPRGRRPGPFPVSTPPSLDPGRPSGPLARSVVQMHSVEPAAVKQPDEASAFVKLTPWMWPPEAGPEQPSAALPQKNWHLPPNEVCSQSL